MEIKEIMYLVLWAGLGLYCLLSAKKIHPILYLFGGFFAFMFTWYLINDLIKTDLFSGIYSIIFRGICIAFLSAAVIIYVIIKKKQQ